MFAARFLVLLSALALAANAHIGSPDVFFKGNAGPYPLLISIRPPEVIPGVAHIQVRSLGDGVRTVDLTPTPMTGPAAQHPPVADPATASTADPGYFEGVLWLMTPGSWQVHIHVSGDKGTAELPVPVQAIATRSQPMSKGTTAFLIGMLVFLTTGLIAIVGAAVESPLGRRSWRAMGVTGIILVAALWSGWKWWGMDAATAAKKIYQPLVASATLNSGNRLDLRIEDPGWLPLRKLDNLVPDHGHLMHLFLISWPSMTQAVHLHPDQAATGYFIAPLPSVPAGTYKIFADIVHEDGLAETAPGTVTLPAIQGSPVTGDDSDGSLTTGYRMVWNNPIQPVVNQINLYSFSLLDPAGKPVTDLEPYMGMGGHAEFIKDDGTVFAHVHPSGSVSMAAMAVASTGAMRAMHQSAIGSEVSFPYGLPSKGDYKVFVQMKRAGKVETGAFRIHVG